MQTLLPDMAKPELLKLNSGLAAALSNALFAPSGVGFSRNSKLLHTTPRLATHNKFVSE